jgi:hypothetical protein
MRQRQKENFDKHHCAKELKPLVTGDKVWIPDVKSWNNVQGESQTRSCQMEECTSGIEEILHVYTIAGKTESKPSGLAV